ncbi:hypothetical protein [Cellulomonas sp. NS3]|uniref:hypothetical protein n=1 Tax=Cellulomonas sp. NS3 TaxID=2973977 RepID=UPI0021618E69|nr:hypothetical protein [Cellulomonas sp. NS3]
MTPTAAHRPRHAVLDVHGHLVPARSGRSSIAWTLTHAGPARARGSIGFVVDEAALTSGGLRPACVGAG